MGIDHDTSLCCVTRLSEREHYPKKLLRLFLRQTAVWYNQPMKRELMDILVCPVCKGELELTVEEENEKEIVTGSLYCAKCDVRYPIEETIPNLLPPE